MIYQNHLRDWDRADQDDLEAEDRWQEDLEREHVEDWRDAESAVVVRP